MANVWPATQSQLYGELNKLANQGLIEVCGGGGRGRKEYRATDAGRTELVRWIKSPEEDPANRNAFMLRVFLLSELPPEEARQHLLAIAESSDTEIRRLEGLRDSIRWADDDPSFFARSVLEYGLGKNDLDGRWAKSVIAGLDARAKNLSG